MYYCSYAVPVLVQHGTEPAPVVRHEIMNMSSQWRATFGIEFRGCQAQNVQRWQPEEFHLGETTMSKHDKCQHLPGCLLIVRSRFHVQPPANTAQPANERRRQIECIEVDNIRHGLVDTHAQHEHRKGQSSHTGP